MRTLVGRCSHPSLLQQFRKVEPVRGLILQSGSPSKRSLHESRRINPARCIYSLAEWQVLNASFVVQEGFGEAPCGQMNIAASISLWRKHGRLRRRFDTPENSAPGRPSE